MRLPRPTGAVPAERRRLGGRRLAARARRNPPVDGARRQPALEQTAAPIVQPHTRIRHVPHLGFGRIVTSEIEVPTTEYVSESGME